MNIPVTYHDPVGGKSFGTSAPVLTVTAEDVKRIGCGKICGNCKNFEPGHVMAEMVRTEFLPKLVKELEWKPEHLGAAITDEAGLCGERPGLVTSTFSAAHNCDSWRENNGKMKRQTKDSEKQSWSEQRRAMLRMSRERLKKQRQEYLARVGLEDESK